MNECGTECMDLTYAATRDVGACGADSRLLCPAPSCDRGTVLAGRVRRWQTFVYSDCVRSQNDREFNGIDIIYHNFFFRHLDYSKKSLNEVNKPN